MLLFTTTKQMKPYSGFGIQQKLWKLRMLKFIAYMRTQEKRIQMHCKHFRVVPIAITTWMNDGLLNSELGLCIKPRQEIF
jgi:hypothetical protein